MIVLRDYQLDSVRRIAQVWRKKPLLVAPCGSGKTTIAAEVVARAVEKGNPCLFLVHRAELLDQATERLASFGIEAGQIMAGRKEKPSMVQVASIQTLARRELPPFKIVICDEAHHAVSPTWKRVIDAYAERGACVIGMTATPFRLDGKGLGAIFGEIVVATTAEALIAHELLVEPTIYAPAPPDLSGIKTVAGDYAQDELAARMSQEGIVSRIVEHWMQLAGERPTVCYAVNIEHSQYIVSLFREHGIAAEHVDGSTPKSVRFQAQARLMSGETKVLSNCQVYTEGVDLPALGCAIIARPTKSQALWIQMQGRVMRACPGKDGAVILDHAGNVQRLGLVTDPLEYSLHDKVKKKGEGSPPICPACYVVVKPNDKVCPKCGTALDGSSEPSDIKRGAKHREGRLVKYERKNSMARYTELVEEAWRLGRKLGWARYRYKDEFGVWPRGMRELEAERYPCTDHSPESAVYGSRAVMRCSRCMCELGPALIVGGPEEGWLG